MALASMHLWSGNPAGFDLTCKLTAEYMPHFYSRITHHPLSSCTLNVTSEPFDLSPYTNIPGHLPDPTLAKSQWELYDFRPGMHKWRNIDFSIICPFKNDTSAITVFTGRLKRMFEDSDRNKEHPYQEQLEKIKYIPEKVAIPLNRKIQGLVFIHFLSGEGIVSDTTDHLSPLSCAEKVGFYKIKYSSGRTMPIELHYHYNIESIHGFLGTEYVNNASGGPPTAASLAALTRNKGLGGLALWGYEWSNPYPCDEVVSVTMQACDTESNTFPVLVALTLLT